MSLGTLTGLGQFSFGKQFGPIRIIEDYNVPPGEVRLVNVATSRIEAHQGYTGCSGREGLSPGYRCRTCGGEFPS